jgi:hypothetical protein
MEIPNPKFQNPNKLQLPIPKLMRRLFHDLILRHLAIGLLDIIGYYLSIGACLPAVGREFGY